MTSNHQMIESPWRVSQSLRSDRCQNILYKAVFEHFKEINDIAALLLASKSFQNSSFGANYILNFIIEKDSIRLIDSVLSPSSCMSVQFAPSLHIKQKTSRSEKINRAISNFVGEMVKAKYLPSSLRTLTLEAVQFEVLAFFFGSSTSIEWPQLQFLALSNCGVDDAVLEVISKKALQLRSASFVGNSRITDAGLAHLSNLSAINSLNLCFCNRITDVGLEHLSKVASITSLDLSLCDKVTDVGLEALVKLPNVSSLTLFGCRTITDVGLEHISKIPSVTSLDLADCKLITDVGLEHVYKLAGLNSIGLGGCSQITDADLEKISNVAGVTSLNLSGCYEIGDAGLEHLSLKLAGLTSLDVSCCNKITDAGIQHLAKLSKITSLNLFCLNYVTVEEKNKLKEALPNWKITE